MSMPIFLLAIKYSDMQDLIPPLGEAEKIVSSFIWTIVAVREIVLTLLNMHFVESINSKFSIKLGVES